MFEKFTGNIITSLFGVLPPFMARIANNKLSNALKLVGTGIKAPKKAKIFVSPTTGNRIVKIGDKLNRNLCAEKYDRFGNLLQGMAKTHYSSFENAYTAVVVRTSLGVNRLKKVLGYKPYKQVFTNTVDDDVKKVFYGNKMVFSGMLTAPPSNPSKIVRLHGNGKRNVAYFHSNAALSI